MGACALRPGRHECVGHGRVGDRRVEKPRVGKHRAAKQRVGKHRADTPRVGNRRLGTRRDPCTFARAKLLGRSGAEAGGSKPPGRVAQRRSAHDIRRFHEQGSRRQGSIQDANHSHKFARIDRSVKSREAHRGHPLCFDNRFMSHAGNPFRRIDPAFPASRRQDRKIPACPRGPESGPWNNGVGYCADKK